MIRAGRPARSSVRPAILASPGSCRWEQGEDCYGVMFVLALPRLNRIAGLPFFRPFPRPFPLAPSHLIGAEPSGHPLIPAIARAGGWYVG